MKINLKPRDENILDGYRNEIKMPLDRQQYENFLPNCYQLGLYPSFAFPDRRVNSIYYDTRALIDYEDNVSGLSTRQKTRIRWYDGDLSKMTLERKIKRNKASRKESISIANPELIAVDTREGFGKILSGMQDSAESARTASLFPVLEVQYDRQYFMLAPELRMTIDRRQKFRRLHPIPVTHFMDSSVYAVVEFKYPASKSKKMRSILRDLPFRIFRHSKYVIGLETTIY